MRPTRARSPPAGPRVTLTRTMRRIRFKTTMRRMRLKTTRRCGAPADSDDPAAAEPDADAGAGEPAGDPLEEVEADDLGVEAPEGEDALQADAPAVDDAPDARETEATETEATETEADEAVVPQAADDEPGAADEEPEAADEEPAAPEPAADVDEPAATAEDDEQDEPAAVEEGESDEPSAAEPEDADEPAAEAAEDDGAGTADEALPADDEPDATDAEAAEGEPGEADAPIATEPDGDAPEAAEQDEQPAAEEAEAEAEAEAAAEESGEILDEEELAEAQRESIAAAVAARLAEEEAKSEEQQAEEASEREQMLGSALAGAAIGALLPAIGARLVGQDGDRVILQQDDRLVVRSDETRRFLAAGGESVAEELAEGRVQVTTTYPDGTRIVTLRDPSGELVRRVRILPNGDEIVLFDEGEVTRLAADELPPIRRDQQRTYFLSRSSEADIAEALAARPLAEIDRRYTIRQIREHEELRWLMPSLALDAVTFETDSAELGIDQVRALDDMGRVLAEMIAREPDEVFLVEGHTDAVGSDVYNLALSDRRAETVATLLNEVYDVPPENLVTQGFGEQDLKVPTMGPSRENRRVELRRITPLLR
jgi:outer membrane protein OmpA-like peptidoglycan-associated protein